MRSLAADAGKRVCLDSTPTMSAIRGSMRPDNSFDLRIAAPPELAPRPELLAWRAEVGARCRDHDPMGIAARLLTDTWCRWAAIPRTATICWRPIGRRGV